MAQTETIRPIDSTDADRPSRRLICLVASLVLSSVTIVVGAVIFWQTYVANQARLEGPNTGHDVWRQNRLMGEWVLGTSRGTILFWALAIGVVASILAFVGSKAAERRPWFAMLTGVLATAVVMVPLVVAADAWLASGTGGFGLLQ